VLKTVALVVPVTVYVAAVGIATVFRTDTLRTTALAGMIIVVALVGEAAMVSSSEPCRILIPCPLAGSVPMAATFAAVAPMFSPPNPTSALLETVITPVEGKRITATPVDNNGEAKVIPATVVIPPVDATENLLAELT